MLAKIIKLNHTRNREMRLLIEARDLGYDRGFKEGYDGGYTAGVEAFKKKLLDDIKAGRKVITLMENGESISITDLRSIEVEGGNICII